MQFMEIVYISLEGVPSAGKIYAVLEGQPFHLFFNKGK